MLVKMLSINEVNFPSLFNLVGLKILGLKQKMDMVFRKVMVVSVIVNMSILKSPIINVGFFVLDILCSIACIYSLNRSILEYSGGRYITPIKVFSKLLVSISTKIDSKIIGLIQALLRRKCSVFSKLICVLYMPCLYCIFRALSVCVFFKRHRLYFM